MKEIILSQGKIAIIDDCDFEKISQHKWFAKKDKNKYYAIARIKTENGKYKTIQMHSFIISTKKGLVTDHIDGDGLNNQRLNLRECTNSENALNRGKNKNNTSGFKGVSFIKSRNKWQSEIIIKGKRKWLGYFEDKLSAYNAYCEYGITNCSEFFNKA